jgi:hypothetical protein
MMTAFLFYYALLHALVMGLLLPSYTADPTIKHPFLAAALWPVWLFIHVVMALGESKHGNP